MLDSFPVTLILGCVFGALAGIGIGGGSLLMLWLTLVLNLPYSDARMLNLLFFIPCAVTATLLRYKEGPIPYKVIWPAIAAGCISSAVFSLIGEHVNPEVIKKVFAILLLIIGIREILYKDKH